MYAGRESLAQIDWGAIVPDMLIIAVAAAAGTLLVMWLILPAIVRRFFDTHVRKELDELRREQTLQFAHLRSEMAMQMDETAHRLHDLGAEQAGVLNELARRLSDCANAIGRLVDAGTDQARLLAAVKAAYVGVRDLNQYFENHRDRLPEELCGSVQDLCPKIEDSFQEMVLALDAGGPNGEFYRLQLEMQVRFDDLITPIRSEIDAMVRNLEQHPVGPARESGAR
jgi:hypothetical protein